MYNSQELAQRIKSTAKKKNISVKKMLSACKLSKNTLSSMQSGGSMPKSENLASIADYLDCSVDFLLGRPSLIKMNEIEVALSEVFNQDNGFTRYIFHIWEAFNEIVATNELFKDIFQWESFKRRSDWIVIFKYNIIVLSEAAKIINLDSGDMKKIFSDARKKLLSDIQLNELFNRFCDFYGEKKNREFFTKMRNCIAHFDHEKEDAYSDAIRGLKRHSLYEYKNILCDFNSPVYLEAIKNIYRENINPDEDDVIKAIINLYKKLIDKTTAYLKKAIEYYFAEYTVIVDADEHSVIYPQGNSPYYKFEVKNNDNNRGFIGNANAPVTINNTAETTPSPEEKELLRIFENLDIKKRMKLMQFAYGLEEGK